MRVHIIGEALPPLALAAVCRDAHALADCDNFWVTKERILQGPAACSTPAELAVCLLHQHVAHLLPAAWQGAEYWVQVYKPGAGLGFHFDKDEHLLKATGQMQHPVWSSILYLTGSSSSSSSSSSSHSTLPAHEQQHHAQPQTEVQPEQQQQQPQQQRPDLSTLQDWDGVCQAPTVILDQLYDQQAGCPVPAAPSSSMVVWPVKGTYCLFDGRLGHGVLDSCSSSIRATLLVNWWTSCPQAVEPLQDSRIEQRQLTRLDRATLQQLVSRRSSSSSGGSGGGAGAAADAPHCSSLTKQMANVSLSGVSSSWDAEQDTAQQSGHHQQQQQQQQQQQPQRPEPEGHMPCLRVTADAGRSSDEDGSMQLVDDVLAHHNLTLIGPTAVSAVRFNHPGFMLCPIEDPSASSSTAAAAAADGSSGGSSELPPRLQTLAAFVSAELMEDDSSSCSDGDGAGEAGA